jgi:glycosyltransferase involved in cell wall biosynthesis
MLRIHQFAAATAVGDGVTTSLFFIRKLLRALGHDSEIHACHIPPALAPEIRPVESLEPRRTDLLLIHHSMGHDHDRLIERLDCPRVLVYHNITPAEFFERDSPNHRYSIKGREQLARWRDYFDGAIGLSPYNSEELAALGYRRIATLPLLIELDRFTAAQAERPEWTFDLERPFILSVGRLVENKRQHRLIEALWHLKRLNRHGALPRLILVGGTTSQGYATALHAHAERLGLAENVLIPGKCSDAQLRWLYERAAAYWCASAHEGFCMPLIESGFFGVPVAAFATSNIPATLGESGLLIETPDPRLMAAATLELMDGHSLRDSVIAAGRRNLERYSEATLRPQLAEYLALVLDETQPRSTPHR